MTEPTTNGSSPNGPNGLSAVSDPNGSTPEPMLGLPLPEGWVRTDMDTATLEGMSRFVDQTAPITQAVGLQVGQIREMLREMAADVRLNDVRLAATWLHTDNAGTLVQANLSVLVVPANIREALADDPVWDMTTLEHPDGDRMIRRTRQRPLDQPIPAFSGNLAGLDGAFSNLIGLAQYFREVPGTGNLALATFSSLTLVVWDNLLNLFDAIMLRSRWE
jgi:hypothetical protein